MKFFCKKCVKELTVYEGIGTHLGVRTMLVFGDPKFASLKNYKLSSSINSFEFKSTHNIKNQSTLHGFRKLNNNDIDDMIQIDAFTSSILMVESSSLDPLYDVIGEKLSKNSSLTSQECENILFYISVTNNNVMNTYFTSNLNKMYISKGCFKSVFMVKYIIVSNN